MQVRYYYCNDCGYEDFNVKVKHSRQVANGNLYYCPKCNKEHFADIGEE